MSNDIGVRIKEERIKLGLTQKELADKIGISLDTVRSLETGRRVPGDEVISKMSSLFRCPVEYLINGNPEKGFYPVNSQINEWLNDNGKSQEWLSDITGISIKKIKSYCDMKTIATMQDAKLISFALNIPMDALYVWEIVNEEVHKKMLMKRKEQ